MCTNLFEVTWAFGKMWCQTEERRLTPPLPKWLNMGNIFLCKYQVCDFDGFVSGSSKHGSLLRPVESHQASWHLSSVGWPDHGGVFPAGWPGASRGDGNITHVRQVQRHNRKVPGGWQAIKYYLRLIWKTQSSYPIMSANIFRNQLVSWSQQRQLSPSPIYRNLQFLIFLDVWMYFGCSNTDLPI